MTTYTGTADADYFFGTNEADNASGLGGDDLLRGGSVMIHSMAVTVMTL